MSNLEIIAKLCEMLDDAQQIIKGQAELLAMHGIETSTGALEADRARLLNAIEQTI